MFKNTPELFAVQMAGAYLDTSVVRAYSSKDTWLKHASAHTSVLTIIELLDGCTTKQSEYSARRSAIRRLIDWEIPIAPFLPIMTAMRAFPYVHNMTDISTKEFDTVMALAMIMIETECVEKFDAHLEKFPVWIALKKGYAFFARNYVESFGDQTKTLRNAVQNSSAKNLKNLSIDESISTNDRMGELIKSPMCRNISLFALAKAAAVSIGKGNNVDIEMEIYKSYNQSAIPYIDAISVGFITRMSRGELPQVNDLYDKEHFAYLEPKVLLVSNDKRMRALASSIGLTVADHIKFRSMAQERIAYPE